MNNRTVLLTHGTLGLRVRTTRRMLQKQVYILVFSRNYAHDAQATSELPKTAAFRGDRTTTWPGAEILGPGASVSGPL